MRRRSIRSRGSPSRPACRAVRRVRASAAEGRAARSPHTPEGRAALLHAIAHIEFNAINLALDAVWRFPACLTRTTATGCRWRRGGAALHAAARASAESRRDYGDFDAHDGLWLMAQRTAHDALARMALVPRTLEARGPRRHAAAAGQAGQAGDARAVEILGVILRDEVGHVAIGNRWYRWLCARDGLDPLALYPVLATRYGHRACGRRSTARRGVRPASATTRSTGWPDAPPYTPPRHQEEPMRLTPYLACLALALAACSKQEPATGATAGSAPAPAVAKVYIVGTDAAYAPFESQNERAEIVGFDIDVVGAVAKKAGLAVKFVNTPWEGIFNALDQGDRDLLVSAITITDQRRQTMDFTNPYFDAHQLIAVKADSKVTRLADLKPLKVGVQTGTTGDEAVSKLQGKNSVSIKRFESTPLALKELEAGGGGRRRGRQRRGRQLRDEQRGRQVQDGERREFVPEQYGIASRRGTRPAGQAERRPGGHKADGTYQQLQCEVLRRRAGRRPGVRGVR
jgi:polar amino acid transport system substrate-binding protein